MVCKDQGKMKIWLMGRSTKSQNVDFHDQELLKNSYNLYWMSCVPQIICVVTEKHMKEHEQQGAAMARRAFDQLYVVYQLCPFLDRENLCSVTQALVISHLDYYNVVYPWKVSKSFSGCKVQPHELYWVPCSTNCVGCQFALMSNSRCWLWQSIKAYMAWGQATCETSLVLSHWPAPPGQAGKVYCRFHQLKHSAWLGPRREPSLSLPPLYGIFSFQMWGRFPTLLSFEKEIKTWLCNLAGGPQRSTQ